VHEETPTPSAPEKRQRSAGQLNYEPRKENGGPANHANHAKPKGVAEAEPPLEKGELLWTLEFSLSSSPFACFRVVSGQSIPVSRTNLIGPLRDQLHIVALRVQPLPTSDGDDAIVGSGRPGQPR
jgi:hypothetical protein